MISGGQAMDTFEFEGKNTEEAIEHACRELDVPRDELEIEVLEPGSAGIFGLVGGRKARVRVRIVKEEAEEPAPPAEVPASDEEAVRVAKGTLEKILSLIPIEAAVDIAQEDGKIALKIQGDRSGILIGRKGRTLDAIQFLVNKIVTKALDRKVQVVIDSEDYRDRRKESLTQMALKMGEKVKRLKKPMATNPLNPHDRRIVHLALRDDAELDTKSRGEGVLKKVVILPKK
jgi:spoIIIJ-associated protein